MDIRRIAYILNIFPKVSETFIAGELAELRRRGIEVRVLSLVPPRVEPRHEIISRAALDRITSYETATFSKIIRDFSPDLLHAHFAKEATEMARQLSAECDVPFSFTAHGYDIHRKPPEDFFERACAAFCLITVSESNARYIHRTFGVSRTHIHVVPCGVDTDRFCPRNGSARQAQPPLVLVVARQVEVKNLALLLQACALLRRRGIPFRCVMVGDGPVRARLLAQRAQLNLEDVVEMPGAANQTQVLEHWQQAHVGALTSHNEGMPVCLMEAAACGVPVVATRVGGIPELVEDGITGLLTHPGDAKEFACTLELLLTVPHLRQRMGQAARSRAEQRFSVVRQVDSLLGIWSRAVKGVCA